MWRDARATCTVEELTKIIKAPSNGSYALPSEPCNQVYPGLFIGDSPTALCTSGLREMGITHVLNAAQGRRTTDGYDGYVNTNAFYYSHAGIAFLGVPAPDFVSFRLTPFFRDAADFIDRALEEQGESWTAKSKETLERLEMTHVVNAAQGRDEEMLYVDTDQAFYEGMGIPILFVGVEAVDATACQIRRFFDPVAGFIDDALSRNGRVLVHCREGISRSATLVLAFLMIKRNYTVQEAVRLVRSKREIIPNEGFLQQLCDLNDALEKERRVNGRLC
ncbi:unnamed protein product [Darwinula stevensoni]|uniref:protein-serine/threonine phosphatase n=1 Tax=Darwinula stevensoni TaxID=69355 RepID=A0A7R9ABQ2_9CRUS|nr:unnamed protein product [Darwinula stevensoni]CAG0899138.1 unnamed protein product [Darwinula stevensoni]